jgi:Rps23 Pro-64 3,4-dihydroxylase Tpa1-like proline 4-hydroxylase
MKESPTRADVDPTAQRDYVSIRGVRIALDAVISPAMLASAEALRDQFAAASPFPHLVIDGLFSSELLQLVLDEFDRMKRQEWDRYDSADELKRGSNPRASLGPATQLYFDSIHSRPFVRFLETVTGIGGLLPDPMLFAGGMHEIPDGGRFSVHVDFNRHPVNALENRLVLITYLNHDWQRAYGGALELWDPRTRTKVRDVDPHFGRTIVFAQSPDALHGHPDPVHAPGRRPRRSVAAYFYSRPRTEAVVDDAYRTTQVVVRPRSPAAYAAVKFAKYVTPPMVLDLARTLRRGLRPR